MFRQKQKQLGTILAECTGTYGLDYWQNASGQTVQYPGQMPCAMPMVVDVVPGTGYIADPGEEYTIKVTAKPKAQVNWVILAAMTLGIVMLGRATQN